MKTTLLSAAFFIAASFNSYAQSRSADNSNPLSLAKGSLQLGVNGTGSFSQGINGKSRGYLVAPWAGYLVHDRLVAGLSVTFTNDKFTSKDISVVPGTDNTNVSPELFARYYLLSGKFKPFAELGAGYNFLKSDGAKENGAYLSPAVGLNYWLGQRFALEASYKFKLQSKEMKRVDPASNLRFRVGFTLVIR